MVGGHHDQGLVGMALIEGVRHGDGLVEVEDFEDGAGQVLAVCGPINQTAFRHEEETLRIAFQHRDGRFDDLRQLQGAFGTAEGIGAHIF